MYKFITLDALTMTLITVLTITNAINMFMLIFILDRLINYA